MRRFWSVVWLLVCGAVLLGDAVPETVPSASDGVTLQREFKLGRGQEVSQRFHTMGGGGKAASVRRARDGRKFLFLPVTFAQGDRGRVAWDIEVEADWSEASAIVFDMTAEKHLEVGTLVLYAHSGDGWYACRFGLDIHDGWSPIQLAREDFAKEGKPGSWGKVDRIRLAAWASGDQQDGWYGLANFGVWKVKPSRVRVAVIRGEQCKEHYKSESRSFDDYAETILTSLHECGIQARMISDRETTYEQLRSYRMVVLPHNPWMPAPLISGLRRFVAKGGKVLAFFTLPQEINELLGLRFEGRGWARPSAGCFGGFLASDKPLPGQARLVPQNSYFTRVPVKDCGRVLATWAEADGRDSGIPALLLLPHGAYISHVWMEGAGTARNQLLEILVNEFMPVDQVKRLRRRLRHLGRQDVGGSWSSLVARVRHSGHAEAWRCLEKTASLSERAQRFLQRGDWQQAASLVSRAEASAQRAFFLTCTSRRGEHRLLWCHDSAGVAGLGWDRSVRHLSECGFAGVLANMCWSGCAYYASDVLPRYAGFESEGDRLKSCLAACKRYGVACHVWKVCFKMGTHASRSFVDGMVSSGRVQVSRNGEVSRGVLCPTDPRNQRDEIESLVEVVRKYPAVAGIHFDYIRFSDGEACFCPGCRARFEAYVGRKLPVWPFAVSDAALLGQWHSFRRRAINQVVRTVHDRVKGVRPSVQISAAVYTNWDQDRDEVGQDVELWCRKRWVDFICPMDYREADVTFRSLVRYQQRRCHGVPVYPGIGLSCWKKPDNAFRLVRQIELVRGLGLDGFAVFNYDQNSLVPLSWLKIGCTKIK